MLMFSGKRLLDDIRFLKISSRAATCPAVSIRSIDLIPIRRIGLGFKGDPAGNSLGILMSFNIEIIGSQAPCLRLLEGRLSQSVFKPQRSYSFLARRQLGASA
jgi:hypothetical protein